MKSLSKYSRSIPYFKSLLKTTSSKRVDLLHTFPTFVVDDLVEILYNLGKENVVKKYKRPLVDIVNLKSKKRRRLVIYRQTGGFLGTLIPIVLTLLGQLINT